MRVVLSTTGQGAASLSSKLNSPLFGFYWNYNPVQKELRHCVYFKKKFILGHLCFLFPSPPFQCCHGRKIYWKILHTQHWKGGGGNRQDSMQFHWKLGINPRLMLILDERLNHFARDCSFSKQREGNLRMFEITNIYTRQWEWKYRKK